mmetsp:Transcript_53179/g.134352  ORF Transcript_53179/g.134352 Transcript_53179/m.134352 type:complete len:209 (-) Transcript_53179:631-1257(-)
MDLDTHLGHEPGQPPQLLHGAAHAEAVPPGPARARAAHVQRARDSGPDDWQLSQSCCVDVPALGDDHVHRRHHDGAAGGAALQGFRPRRGSALRLLGVCLVLPLLRGHAGGLAGHSDGRHEAQQVVGHLLCLHDNPHELRSGELDGWRHRRAHHPRLHGAGERARLLRRRVRAVPLHLAGAFRQRRHGLLRLGQLRGDPRPPRRPAHA